MKNLSKSILTSVLLFIVGCSDPHPANQNDKLPVQDSTKGRSAVTEPAISPEIPPKGATFTEILEWLGPEYYSLSDSFHCQAGNPSGERYDFVQGKFISGNTKVHLRASSLAANCSPSLLRLPSASAGLPDLLFHTAEFEDFDVIWVHGEEPSRTDGTSPVSSRLAGLPSAPNIPGCFIRMKKFDRLIFIVGIDEDGTAFEKPFSSISQIRNIYNCDANLQAKGRLYCYRGKVIHRGRFKLGDENKEQWVEIGMPDKRLSLGEMQLADLDSLFALETAGGQEVKILPDVPSVPLWYDQAGLLTTSPNNHLQKEKRREH